MGGSIEVPGAILLLTQVGWLSAAVDPIVQLQYYFRTDFVLVSPFLYVCAFLLYWKYVRHIRSPLGRRPRNIRVTEVTPFVTVPQRDQTWDQKPNESSGPPCLLPRHTLHPTSTTFAFNSQCRRAEIKVAEHPAGFAAGL